MTLPVNESAEVALVRLEAEVTMPGGLCVIGDNDEKLDHDAHAHAIVFALVECCCRSSCNHRSYTETDNDPREIEDDRMSNDGINTDASHCDSD